MSAHEDANGLLSEYRWREIDGLPRVVGFRHSGGERLTFEYDFENGTRRATREDGAQAHWLVDDDDNVARFTDYDGRQTTFVYRDGELCHVILPGGAMRRSTWDKYGRMTSETDPAGRRTEYHWHRLTDRITRTVYPDGTSSQAMYDLRGRLLSETDPAGSTTAYRYPDDEEFLPESITDAIGGVVHWSGTTGAADAAHRLLRQRHPLHLRPLRAADCQRRCRREYHAAGVEPCRAAQRRDPSGR